MYISGHKYMDEDFDDNEIFTPERIANMWGLCPGTIRGWCRSGRLKSRKWGTKYAIRGRDFREFMNGR